VDGNRKGTSVQTKNNKIEQLVLNPELFLMDIPTAALRMSTTVFAVRELCRSGQLKFVSIGHKWLISPGAIQDFIRAKEQAA
jgi:ABC-type microcin C transport system duplicated ATPase subunit YejF